MHNGRVSPVSTFIQGVQMSKHHETKSPSSFPAKAVCARFLSGPVGEAANRGTIQHIALDRAFKGIVVEQGEMTRDEFENVIWSFSAICGIFEGFGIDHKSINSEFGVSITDNDMNELTFGTIDAGAVFHSESGSVGIIVDYKSGDVRNYMEQMRAYAVGFMQMHGLGSCMTYIVYGRCRKVIPIRFDYDIALQETIDLCESIDNPGDPVRCDYCSWCANFASCPATATSVGAVADVLIPGSNSICDPKTATSEQLVEMKKIAEVVADWSEVVASEMKSRLQAGALLPGYTLQKKSGAATVDDMAAAVAVLKLPPVAFMASCTVSIPKLSEAYSDAFGGTKKSARAKVEELLSSVNALGRKADSFSVVKV